MEANELSSDPSSYSGSKNQHRKNKGAKIKKVQVTDLDNPNENENEGKKTKKKSTKALPIIHLILSEFLIPLCLIFVAIATLSVTGMFIILIFILHCYVLYTST